MIVGVGIDIIQIKTIEENVHREVYVRKVYTPTEAAQCRSSSKPGECFAGKFAVKEAFMKAVGAGIRQGVAFTDIEVLNRESGMPYINASSTAAIQLDSLQVEKIHVSLSHTENMVVAVVILETAQG